MIIINNISNINLKDTITCGQIFRFEIEDNDSYTVILSDRVINIKKLEDKLYVKSNNYENLEKIVRDYFDLDRDYNKLNEDILKIDKNLNGIISDSLGLKIINQPKFETLISYILSSNNRVAQIAKALDNISQKYGKKIIFENKEYFLFPNPSDMKNCTIEELRNLKTGFRDKYVYEIVNKINNNEFSLEKIENMNSNDALLYLMNNKGIGEKVASCILLFGYSKLDVFPVDTWVKKYMKDNYNIENINEIYKYTKTKYGKYSGIVIQYMFNSKRNKN